LLFAVSHKFGIANSSFLPLIISESVQLDSHLENALQIFSSGLDFDLWQINLKSQQAFLQIS